MAPSRSRTRVRREPFRGVYDREAIDAILDEGLVAHLGFVEDGQPYVIPTLYGRIGDTLYIHGSSASRMVRELTGGIPACLTVTLIDGLVLARSVFNHSMNYRSVVVLGDCRAVEGPEEREAALHAFTEALIPGRWDEVRPPGPQELKATRVLAMDLDEFSAKVRSGPPDDDEADHDLPVWAGEIPLPIVPGAPVPDPTLAAGIEPSSAVTGWTPERAGDRLD